MRLALYLISMALGVNLMSMAHADDEHHGHEHDEHRHHGVHVHGMATLDIVMDGQELMIHLQSPLMNFSGFEYQPETEQEKAIYQDLLQQLEMLDTLLKVQGSSCVAESIAVEDPYAVQNKAGHADVVVSYFLRCEDPQNITGLKINLFDIYNRLETLQVQIVLPVGQQQLELNPQRTTIRVN